jgi:Exostosin family
LQNPEHPNYIDRQYCAWLYGDDDIEIVSNWRKAGPVDALLYEMCLVPPRHPEELVAWARQAPTVSAWNSSWHESTFWANLRSELRIVSNFIGLMPRTRSVVMHNGRLFLRPTALFSRSQCQGAFVHPYFLADEALRHAMFDTPWDARHLRKVRLIFAGDAASPRRKKLLEDLRQSLEKRSDVKFICNYKEAMAAPDPGSGAEKPILWLAEYERFANRIPWHDWPVVLQESDFCLCPPGYEQKSHRVVECLLSGSIPIVHCPEEYAIDLEDDVNCIVVRNDDWEQAVRRALSYDQGGIRLLRHNVWKLLTRKLSHRAVTERWLGYMGKNGSVTWA